MDAEVEDGQASYLPLIENNLDNKELATYLANWFVNLEIPLHRQTETTTKLADTVRLATYLTTYNLIKADKLSSTNAKALLNDLLVNDNTPTDIAAYAEGQGFLQVSDEGEVAKIVSQVISENAKAAEDVKQGETKATQFLVGQVMKLSRGKANPQVAQELIKKQLGLNS